MEEANQLKNFILFGQPYWIAVFVTAFVVAGATFGGVLLSFYLENKRRHREERNVFRRLLDSVLLEAVSNETVLNIINQRADVGARVAVDIEINSLQIALNSHLTYNYAPSGLIAVMGTISVQLSALKNTLKSQRTTPLTQQQVEQLKSYSAECRRMIIEILQPQIKLLRPQFKIQTGHHKRSKEIDKKIEEILDTKL
jgi:hypothetical protein